MKRKFFSILTALALCLTLLPTAVWAEEADAAVQEEGHTHYLCGGDTCTGIGHTCTEKTTFTAWTSNNSLPETGVYYLTQDVTLPAEYDMTVTGDLTLDLNGHSIIGSSNKSTICAQKTGCFTLTDCNSSHSTHKFSESSDGNHKWVWDENGSITVDGGVITHGSTSGGWGVLVILGGKFTMYGGTVCGNYVSANWGAGVNVNVGAFTMYGGAIKGNAATGGGGVYVNDNTTFTMHGGEISENKAVISGGGAHVGSQYSTAATAAVFTMTGGKISENKVTGNANKVTVSGGSGVYVDDNAIFTMSGNAKITGNTVTDTATPSTANGGGVCLSDSSAFRLSGPVEIKDNQTNNADNNVYLPDNTAIQIIGGLTGSASAVGVTLQTMPGADQYVSFAKAASGVALTDTDKNVFFIDNDDSTCKLTRGSNELLITHGHIHPVCGDICTHQEADGTYEHPNVAWTPTASLPTAAGYYYLTDNVVLPAGETTLPDGVFLCLNGKSIQGTGDIWLGTWLKVNGTLTITDCKDNSGSIGAFKLNSGKLTMYGGTFSEHAVFDPGTTFLMTGHAVNNGILEIDGDAVFTMEGNAESKNMLAITEQSSVQATIRGNAKVTGMIQVNQPQEDARGLKLEGNAYVKTLCGTLSGTKIPVEMRDNAVIKDVNTLSVTLDIHDDAKISFSDPEQSISIAQAALQGNVQITGKKITILINSGEYTLTLQDNVQITGDITLVTYNGDPLTLIMKDNSVIKGSLTYEQENEQSSLVMQDNAKIDGDLDMGKGTVRGSVYCTGEIKSGIFDADSQVICDGTITGGTFYGTVSGTVADSAAVAVTFDSGDAADVQKVLRGQKAVKPTPTKSGYAFEGWFTDAECTQEYDFDTPVLEPLTLTAKWTRVSSGGGGSRGNSYAVSTPKADNGTVTINNGSTAKRGDIVSITVKPDAGYEIGTVTVTDSKGNSISLTDKGDGKYTFTMPDGKVDVKATFVKSEPEQPGKTTFVDVPEGIWYEDAAGFVARRGLMSGVGENLFGGNQSTTRAMLMTILARMDGQDVSGGATWYEKGMNWAKNNGVSDGTMPTANITREQLATMLYSYAKLRGIDTTQGGMAVREFSDYDSISPWAGQSMTWAVNAGILSGRGNNTLAPTAGATRAEMAVMLQQFVGLMEK